MTQIILWGLLVMSIIESIKLFFEYRQHQKLAEEYKNKCFELQESYNRMDQKYQKVFSQYSAATDSLESRSRAIRAELIETQNELLSASANIVAQMEELMQMFAITTDLLHDPGSQKATQDLMNTLNADILKMKEALEPTVSEELGYENEIQF